MVRVRSLSTRFVLTAVGATAVTFLLFLYLVIHQLDRNLARQGNELERLEDAELSRLLDADVALANARLEFQMNDIARRVLGVATRADTIAAIESRNMVAMESVLGPAGRIAEVDALVATDASANVIGASMGDADLVALDRIVRASGLHDRIANTLSTSERSDPTTISILTTKEEVAPFKKSDANGSVSQIVAVPVFDDFGEVIGALIAQRWMRATEPILADFAQITSSAVAVYAGDNLVSTADVASDIVFERQGERLVADVGDQQLIARCGPSISFLTLCTFKPISELYAAQNQLTQIGETEGRRLVNWLIGIGIASALGISAAIAATALPITRPLRKLSEIVSLVAKGDYDVTVENTDRLDEIGDISRAVLLLRDSVSERDRLRASVVTKNITLERQETELRHQNLLFDAALNNMSHGLCMFDEHKRLIVSNTGYCEMFGIDPTKLTSGLPYQEILKLQARPVGWASEESDQPLDPLDWPAEERSSITTRLNDGRTILTTRQPLAGGGWVAIYEDISERQKARERLVHQARHDSLTKLPNRIQLKEQLAIRLEEMTSRPGSTLSVICIDLDEFKHVNDTLGHPTGDLLLKEVATRIVRTSGSDHLVVRLGGDEFAVVTPTGQDADISSLPERIIKVVSEPYALNGQEVIIGTSIGVAKAPEHGTDPDTLLKHGDLALYRAKWEGKNTVRYFEPEMAESARERQQLITDLRNAVDNSELRVFFQPQVRLNDNSIVGFEALVRWQHPTAGMISPLSFVPLAEETGLIVPIGEWVLRESCRQAAEWPLPVRVAVNVSARQLRGRGFVATVISALAKSGLPAARLELEITESVLLQDDEDTRETLLHLKSLGVKVAMDDFGTGYSSLSCLRSFPFDKIKIDQSFVRAMLESDEASSIVTAIIELAENLNIATTAEGIEDAESLAILRNKDCTEGQGFYLGRPQPGEVANEILYGEISARFASQAQRLRA
jgi:diguanylate cyclase (GGDEF)-like protein